MNNETQPTSSSDWSANLSEADVRTAASTLFQPVVNTGALRDRVAKAAGILRSLPALPVEPSLVCEVPESDDYVVAPIGEGLVVGRHEDCDVAIPDCLAMSRRHFQVQFFEGAYLIEDLDSRNGTFINEADSERISRRVLRDGDFILAGGLTFLFLEENDL